MKNFSVRSMFKKDASGYRYYDPNLMLTFVIDERDFGGYSDEQLTEMIRQNRLRRIEEFSKDDSDFHPSHAVDTKKLSKEEQELITKPFRDFRNGLKESFKDFFYYQFKASQIFGK